VWVVSPDVLPGTPALTEHGTLPFSTPGTAPPGLGRSIQRTISALAAHQVAMKII
jgi:hypothetical protein